MPVDFSLAVKKILDSNADFCLQSSFFPTGRTALINAKLNAIVADTPELRHTVTAIVLYPALRWAVDVQSGNESFTRSRMDFVQQLIVDVTGEPPSFKLEKRRRYYSTIKELVQVVDDSLDHIAKYPERGPSFQEVLVSILRGRSAEEGEISYYKVNRNFEEAVYVLDTLSGADFSRLLDEMTDIFSVGQGSDADDFDFAYIHHNTTLLLRHYTRIVWSQNYHDALPNIGPDAMLRDKAVSLLDCDDIESMEAVTENHLAYQDAYKIAEFMKLIGEGIDKVGRFPRYGPESKHVLEVVTDPAKINLTAKELEKEFNYGQTWFYYNRKIAVKLLSFVLWGCSPSELLDMVFQ